MIHEYRVYDIAEGKMDQWIDVFKNTIMPIHQALGVSIPEAWRHDESNEFIWVRTARDADHMDEIHKAVTSDPKFLASTPIFQEVGVKVNQIRRLTPVLE